MNHQMPCVLIFRQVEVTFLETSPTEICFLQISLYPQCFITSGGHTCWETPTFHPLRHLCTHSCFSRTLLLSCPSLEFEIMLLSNGYIITSMKVSVGFFFSKWVTAPFFFCLMMLIHTFWDKDTYTHTHAHTVTCRRMDVMRGCYLYYLFIVNCQFPTPSFWTSAHATS